MATKISSKSITIGIQNNSGGTAYATWKWDKEHTDHYEFEWKYTSGETIWWFGSSGTATLKNTTWKPPDNARLLDFRVKPVSKTYTKNNKETSYWVASWSDWVIHHYEEHHTPETPPVPTVSMDGYKIVSELDSYDRWTVSAEFQIVQNNKTTVATGKAKKTTNHITYIATGTAGNEYKVRARGVNSDGLAGAWSEYSSPVNTIPAKFDSEIILKALSGTSVRLEWVNTPVGAKTIEIQYTPDDKNHFDTSQNVQSVSFPIVKNKEYVDIDGLTSGTTYYFRIRAVNDQGESGWFSKNGSITLGTQPNPPTTWQETSILPYGKSQNLYWMHNSTDGSEETKAYVSMQYLQNGEVERFFNFEVDPKVNQPVNWTQFTAGGIVGTEEVRWWVSTKGIIDKLSDPSTVRSFKTYYEPMAYINVYKGFKWYWDPFNFGKHTIYTAPGEFYDPIMSGNGVVTKFPIFIVGSTQPTNETPINVRFSILSTQAYKTVDYTGEEIWVNSGEEIYSYVPDLSTALEKTETGYDIRCVLLPNNLILENGQWYKIVFEVTMDVGLSASAEFEFAVSFADDEYELNAEIGYDPETVSTYIQPYCKENDQLVSGIGLSLYRRDFDGKFVELIRNVDNLYETTVTDPHPPLDYARYRIVGLSAITGTIFYDDLAAYPIPETAIIIQWDDKWSNFDENNPDALVDPVFSGSLLKLPYNVSVSDTSSPEVELVNYIGREHPVSYYGTQTGQTATWSVDIPREDKETLFALRRLARYRGDCYVREPNGSGYWAHITLSWNNENKSVIIPITINVTRVEGGV